ncbi:MAG: autotransporter-associated beta strand repeat-containing protein [Planctomycetaceae bacterium]|nr:autotransporter-associated beta strand repeat-containing protein [Planctomycetaceae bacterium]
MITQLFKSTAFAILTALALPLLLPDSAPAANILWDGTGTSWNVANNWSLFSNATTPNPAAKPGASDTAIFNIETVNTPQTVNLNSDQAALGLSFNSTGPVSIQTGTGQNTLTLGSGGITVNPGAGMNTIFSSLSMSAPQTWTNDSSSLLSISGPLAYGGNALTVAGSGNTTINGSTFNSNLDVIKNGSGRLALGGVNNNVVSADLLINAGSVRIGSPTGFAALTGGDVMFGADSTGSFDLGGFSITLGTLSTNAVVGTPVVENIGGAPATLSVGKPMNPTTFAGVLRNGTSGGALGLKVKGPITLSGDNQYTGVTEVNDELTLGNANALGSTVGGTILNTTGDLDLRGHAIGAETLTVVSGARLRNTSVTPASWAGNILFDSATGDSFTVQGIADMTLSGQIVGDGLGMKLEKTGSNTLDLTGTANNTAPIRVTDGVLRLAKASSTAIHAVDSTANVAGGTLQLAGTGGDQLAFAVIVSSGSFDVNGRNEQLTALELRGSGIGGSGALVNSANGDSVLSMQPNPSGFGEIRIIDFARIGVPHSDASLTLAGDFESSDGDLQKVGLGTLILTGDNSDYPGDVFLTAGTIAVGSNTALGTGPLTVDGGTLRSEGAARTIGNVVTIGTTAALGGSLDLTLTGAISGAGSLIKSGSGRLTLSAVSNYSGTATVDAGALAVNGSIVGNVVVNSGGSLAGTGAIGGTVTLYSGGVLAPGNSADEITLGSLTMMDGSTMSLEIGGVAAGSQHDQIESAGVLALEGTLQVSLIGGFMPSAGQSFDLLNWGATSGAFDMLSLPALGAGLAWNTSQLYTTGVLSVTTATFLAADFDEDGDVDGADLTRWRTNLGTGTTRTTGDADGDGDADGGDFLVWQRQLGSPATAASTASIPEPATPALLASGALAIMLRRRVAVP